MKKLLVLAAIAVFGFSNVNAQDGVDKVIEQAKNGGFYVGANVGFSFNK
jgi:opacity protein-like surface antigen